MADPRGASRAAKRRADTRDPRRSRERALKILFQADVRGVAPGSVLDRIVDDPHAWVLLDDLDPEEAADVAPGLAPDAAGADPEPGEAAARARQRRGLELDGFTRSLVRGVSDHQAELDQLIQRYARRWTVSRMPAIDRNVLRLGTYELAFETTSPAVVINEVIELAKRLSTEDSGRYVNGVLESVRKHLADRPLTAEGAPAVAPTVPDAAEPPAFDSELAEPLDTGPVEDEVPPPIDDELAEVLEAEPLEEDVLPPPDDDGDAIDLLAEPTPEEPTSADDVEDLAGDDEVDPAAEVDDDAPSGEDLVDPGAGQQQLF
jgi:transcription antitermination protein NusB